MPNITVRLPANALDAAQCRALLQAVHAAAVVVSGLGAAPRQQALCWVMLDVLPAGQWLCGGHDAGQRLIPCQVQVLVPAGVLDDSRRADYARCLHEAVAGCVSRDDPRVLMTSIIITDVADGHWAGNGRLWQRDDFVEAAGYAHLQAVVTA